MTPVEGEVGSQRFWASLIVVNPTQNEVLGHTEDAPSRGLEGAAICARAPGNGTLLSYSMFPYITSFTLPQLFLKFTTFLPATQQTQAVAAIVLKWQWIKVSPQ